MSIKSIIFDSSSVNSIRSGMKTMTRMIIPSQQFDSIIENTQGGKIVCRSSECNQSDSEIHSPIVPGDILYVRESWYKGSIGYMYKADFPDVDYVYLSDKKMKVNWNPASTMPEEAARIRIRVKRAWIEKLQCISEEDAKSEGCAAVLCHMYPEGDYRNIVVSAREHFSEMWDNTISKSDIKRYGWEANPRVLVISFEYGSDVETEQDALSYFQNLPNRIPLKFLTEREKESYDKAFRIVRSALDIRTARMPVYQSDGYSPDGVLVYDEWRCPNCDNIFEVDYDEYDFCPNCGQKIYSGLEYAFNVDDNEHPNDITHADKIRNMSDEELVSFLSQIRSGHDVNYGDWINLGEGIVLTSRDTDIESKLEEWLRSEAE